MPQFQAVKKMIIHIIILFSLFIDCSNKNSDEENVFNPETTIINLTKDSYDVYIGRGIDYHTHMLSGGIKPDEEGWLGNPHPIGWCDICSIYHTRIECIDKFKQDFYKKLDNDSLFYEAVLSLRGKKLGCYCKPKDCHGDIIREWIKSH